MTTEALVKWHLPVLSPLKGGLADFAFLAIAHDTPIDPLLRMF